MQLVSRYLVLQITVVAPIDDTGNQRSIEKCNSREI